jgi:CubicO group peptidase (beta-lactamase class C family)
VTRPPHRRLLPAPAATALALLLLTSLGPLSGPSDRAEALSWPTATPAAEGLDAAAIDRGVEQLSALGGVRTVLVIRHGTVVADRSFGGPGLNGEPHNLKSASKSLLSALVGIGLDRGVFGDAGLGATLGDLLPGYTRGLPEEKRGITLENLLSMESGLRSTSRERYGPWVAHDDWVAAALAEPMVAEPGTEYHYSTGNSHLVSAILTEATGKSTLELARQWLMRPIGGDVASWDRSPEGYSFGGNNLYMTPRDLARLGQLFLRGGRWDGRQVVPSSWIGRSTARHATGWPERYGAYGYFWWIPRDDPWESYAAIGYGGQFLYVVPELDMLVVVTSTLEGKGADWDRDAFRIFREHLFGAARSPGEPAAGGSAAPTPPGGPLPARRSARSPS